MSGYCAAFYPDFSSSHDAVESLQGRERSKHCEEKRLGSDDMFRSSVVVGK